MYGPNNETNNDQYHHLLHDDMAYLTGMSGVDGVGDESDGSDEYIDNVEAGYSNSSQTRSSLALPLVGRIHFVRDTKGFLQVGCILLYWIHGVFTTVFIIMLPRHEEGQISTTTVGVYISIAVLCIFSLFRASTLSPGRLASDCIYDENNAPENWTYCRKCQRMRGPRTQHCRRCGHCVRRRDHHCPWINNCVGEDNHYAFLQLVAYAYILSAFSFIMIMLHYYYYDECQLCNRDVFYLNHSTAFIRILLVTSTLMCTLMGTMYGFHHYSQLMDMTTIDWINMKSTMKYTNNNVRALRSTPQRRKTCKRAYADMCGPGPTTLYWLPCRKRNAPPIVYSSEVI